MLNWKTAHLRLPSVARKRWVLNLPIIVKCIILQADKFLKCDWLRPVVFKSNLKYLHVKMSLVT